MGYNSDISFLDDSIICINMSDVTRVSIVVFQNLQNLIKQFIVRNWILVVSISNNCQFNLILSPKHLGYKLHTQSFWSNRYLKNTYV